MTPPSTRRRFLAGCGATVTLGVAGCPGREAADGETLPDDATRTGTRTASTTGASTTGAGTSDGAEIAVDAAPCPPVPIDRDRAVCSHAADGESGPVSLTVTPERVPLDGTRPAADVAITFTNRSRRDLTFNPHGWRLWHDPGTGWSELEPRVSASSRRTVGSGDSHSWSLTAAVESIRPEQAFQPGRYALVLGVPDPADTDGWIACIALVSLDAA